MAQFIRRHSLLLSTVGLLLLSLQLMSISISHPEFPRAGARALSALLSPGEKLVHELVQSVRFYWSRYLWLVEVEAERDELLVRVKELEARNTRLLEFENENSRLRTILDFGQSAHVRGVVTSVIGRDYSNWVQTITIDHGTSDGIRAGQAVLDGHAVVGQVVAASAGSARVLLLTDTTSALDALIQGSRVNGIVEGGLGSDRLRFNFVIKDRAAAVKIGDRVIASGMDGIFPKGVLIGVVQEVRPEGTGLFQDIRIKPSTDLNQLENVLVVIPGASQREAEALKAAEPAAAIPAIGAKPQ